ncbi:hypothetical protein CFOL_v3_14007 [Cephalotus follicularis]|uniref:Putative plant transposon protein domain-containing protein n=1 Tax=Cephalotus follicularis TaxID=3775 RepID=A0A1Q3BRI2_CEPFO|nr:hypothetical protein CFOL_v3_14007 [Cephalotus follicularis]
MLSLNTRYILFWAFSSTHIPFGVKPQFSLFLFFSLQNRFQNQKSLFSPSKSKPSTTPKKHSSHGGKTPAGSRYKASYAARKVLCQRVVDLSFTTGDKFRLEQWFQSLGWRDFFSINVPYYVEIVKEFYNNLAIVGDNCDVLELKSKVNRVVIKFDDKMLGNILNIHDAGSKFIETKKWPEDPKLVLEDCLRVFYPNENVFGGIAKPTNLLGAAHRLLYHITATHILPTFGGHEKMSYQDLYIIWHVVTGKPLNLPHLIMKNMMRATSKVEGAMP